MAGARKLAATLISGIIMLLALGASGQQPSNVAANTRPDSSVAPVSAAPHAPAEMPPEPPKVTCDGDRLTISAQNSTLGAVLNAIRTCTGAQIDVPESAKAERLFAELGPGPLRTVLADFLSSTDYDYVIKASPSGPQKVQMVLLSPRAGDSPSKVASVVDSTDSTNNTSPNRSGWIKARENYLKSFAAARDDSNQQEDTASSPPVETTVPAPASVEAAAPAASAEPVEATAPAANAAPAAGSVPPGAEPANPVTAPSPDSPASGSLPV